MLWAREFGNFRKTLGDFALKFLESKKREKGSFEELSGKFPRKFPKFGNFQGTFRELSLKGPKVWELSGKVP